jgi:hypothetical protein
MHMRAQVIVVGAGLAGLLAADRLQANGVSAQVLDKARGVGGRMATRRVEQAVFDHGAQYFTARDERFADLVSRWQADGVVQQWSNGFATSDGHWRNEGEPRYCGVGGMTAIAKHLAANLPVQLGERVVSLSRHERQWALETETGNSYTAEALLLTPPVPQSLALLDNSDLALPAHDRQALDKIAYDPCFAVMAVLDGPSAIPEPGGMWLAGEPLYWIADNRQKGISPEGWGVTIHAGAEFTYRHWDMNLDSVGQLVLEAASDWLGAKVLTYQVQRWRYSRPTHLHPAPFLSVAGAPPLVFAGDAFAGPRVEGAALSGLAAADHLLALVK